MSARLVVEFVNRAIWPGFFVVRHNNARGGGYHWPIEETVGGMWEELGRAICLMLVLEGIIPFLYPARWRRLVAALAGVEDRKLRIVGLVSMLLGAGLLYLIK